MKDAATVYAERAKWYDALISFIGYAASRKGILKKIQLDMPEKPRILDLGAGTGLATAALRKRFPGAEIIACDISPEMLQIYHKKFPDIRIIIDDFNDPKELQKLKPFDLIVSTGAVSEYGNYTKAIPFIHKWLKNKGIFLAIGVKRNFIGKLLLKGWHVNDGGKEELIAACKIFSKVDTVPVPWYFAQSKLATYILKATK